MAKAKFTRNHPNSLKIVGRTFHRLTVVSRIPVRSRRTFWLCDCSCGEQTIAIGRNLVSGNTKSCGCLNSEKAAANGRRGTTHGRSGTPEYIAWQAIRRRCNNPSNPAFRLYGARGIKVCRRWNGPHGFANFFADMGPRPSVKHSLDRIDNDKGYSPRNCRWTTMKVQQNNRRGNRLIEHDGRTLTIAEWADFAGLTYFTLYHRLHKGMPIAQAIG